MSLVELLYQYEKLEGDDHIRLFNLLPGREAEALECTISHCSLGNKPSFEALSYVWGSQDTQHILHCNSQILKVGPNLYAALCRLRQSDRARVLWVDKICICQADTDERGHQVSIMSDIFSIASSVIVWLGEAKPDTVAFDLLHRINNYKTSDPGELSGGIWTRASLDPLPFFCTSEEFASMSTPLSNSWFMRAWTYQEAVFANSILVMCGAESMSWNTLLQCLRLLVEKNASYGTNEEYVAAIRWDAELLQDTNNTRAHLQAKSKPNGGVSYQLSSIHQLLVNRRSAHATDPRDKVFSVVNIS